MADMAVRHLVVPALLAAFIVTLLFSVSQSTIDPDQRKMEQAAELKRFTSMQELRAFILEMQKLQPHYEGLPIIKTIPSIGMGVTRTVTQAFEALSAAESAQASRYSETNIHVPGVDEEDIVKTDGEYIYIARGIRIFIVRAYPPAEAGLQSIVNTTGHIIGLYINGDSLIALSGGGFYGVPPMECIDCIGRPMVTANTTIHVFDVSDRGSPLEVRRVTVTGWPVASRMIGEYVYLITSETVFIVPEPDDGVVLPSYSVGEVTYSVEPTMIYYADIPDQSYTYTNILAVNVRNHSEKVSITTVMTPASGTVYVSRENIYLVSLNWVGYSGKTSIHRLTVDGPEVRPKAAGTVPGYLLNQFSLDEHMGYLRVATTSLNADGRTVNSLYVLDMDLAIVGRVENLAPGETIYSVRFMGGKAYLVTFRKVDPLFVVDLENPHEPRLMGKLKIPGYSSYLHPYDDTHLIGVGKEAKPSETGDFAWFQGLKISIFDVSEYTNPRELDTLILGDRGTESEVLYNHRAFLFDRERNMMVIPVLLALIDPSDYDGRVTPDTYGEFVFQGAYVFRISPKDGVEILGRITHLPDGEDLLKSDEYFTSQYMVRRSLFIGDVLYTISDGKILFNNINTLEELGEVKLPADEE